jgi:hypothetical protein
MGERKFYRIWKFGFEWIPGFCVAVKKRVQYDSTTFGWKVIWKKYTY